MKIGLLERILVRRYGQPIITMRRDLNARCWNPDDFDYASVLYIGMKWDSRLGRRFASLKPIYGEAFGGFLIKNSLRITMLLPRKIYGVWSMGDFQMLAPVKKALAIEPTIDFFLDSDNVEYYGHKEGELYVFDTVTDELDSSGPIEAVLEGLMDRWEEAGRP